MFRVGGGGGGEHIKELLGSNASTRVQSRVAEVIFPHRWVSSCWVGVFFVFFFTLKASSGGLRRGCQSYLDARSRVLPAQAAGQSPAAGGDVRHFGNGLHLLRAADAHLDGRQKDSKQTENPR